ncbi:MAG: S8 family serine peptidase [Bacillota bacterium]|nr:S8 family serine peptidase [Bacillota bacterium]
MNRIRPAYVILEYGIGEGTENPLGYVPSNQFKDSSEHMSQIAAVIKENAKFDFRIVSLPYSKAEEWLKENRTDVFVLSASVRGFLNSDFLRQFKDDFYMTCSVGNSASEGEGWNAQKDYFTGIGAVGEDRKLKSYSSYGKGVVDFVGVIKNGFISYTYQGKTHKKRLEGTSFSCPQHTAQVMNLMVDYFNRFGEKPSLSTILTIRDRYTEDVLEPGRDLKSGLGIYTYGKSHLDGVKIKQEEMLFDSLDEVPKWGKSTVEKLINRGALKGGGNGLNLSYQMLRIYVTHDRMGLYDLGKNCCQKE